MFGCLRVFLLVGLFVGNTRRVIVLAQTEPVVVDSSCFSRFLCLCVSGELFACLLVGTNKSSDGFPLKPRGTNKTHSYTWTAKTHLLLPFVPLRIQGVTRSSESSCCLAIGKQQGQELLLFGCGSISNHQEIRTADFSPCTRACAIGVGRRF